MTNDTKRATASPADPLAARLVELRAKATPGPMVVEREDEEGGGISYQVWCHAKGCYCEVASFSTFTNPRAKQDAALYAALVNNLDAIIAALAGRDGWRAGVEAAEKVCREMAGVCAAGDMGFVQEARAALIDGDRERLMQRALQQREASKQLDHAAAAIRALADPASAEDGR